MEKFLLGGANTNLATIGENIDAKADLDNMMAKEADDILEFRESSSENK